MWILQIWNDPCGFRIFLVLCLLIVSIDNGSLKNKMVKIFQIVYIGMSKCI